MTDTTNQNGSVAVVEPSILNTIKKVLGLEKDYTIYDMDITMHINAVMSTLHQLGVGPVEGYMITGDTETWEDFFGSHDPLLNPVKSYMFLRVRLLFDPPTTSFAITAFQDQAKELEWRISAQSDEGYTSG